MSETFLGRSRQLWKLRAFIAVVLLGITMLTVAIVRIGRERSVALLVLFFGGIAVALGGGLWTAYTIRCPGCGSRLFWTDLSQREFSVSGTWIVTLQECPSCGSDGTDSGAKDRRADADG